MQRDDALKLLKGGRSGIDEWNRLRELGEKIPDLDGEDLSDTELGGANLDGAALVGTDLRGTDLSYADLRGADLSGADLRGADLIGVALDRTDLSHVICGWTVFANVDLSAVKGLDSVRPEGPCTIGTDTLLRSKGAVPVAFLRDCGVPEYLIVNQRAMIVSMEPIQFYSCFISHSTRNQDFAEKLYSKMRDHGLRVWYAPEDVKGGKKLYEQIDEAIRIYDKLLLVLSTESVSSEWVKTEIRKARKAELTEKRRKLFPIRLVEFETVRDWECFDADTGKDHAVEIREYFIPDFSNWKDRDSFEVAFARLLEDLKADPTCPGKRR